MTRLFAYVLLGLALATAPGCGSGCSTLEPIPGGFPAASRTQNAGQLRVTQSGLATIAADPAGLLGSLLGGDGLTFDVPASCGGSPSVCCPGGNPVSPCGPIVIDLEARAGDAPRLELRPVAGQSRLDVTVRARVRTMMDVPVNVPIAGDCGLAINTMPGPTPDIRLDIPVSFTQDAQAGTTRIEVGTVNVTQLTSDDVRLNGSFGCQFASLGISFFIGTLTDTFADAIRSAIADQACKACPSGQVAECGPFATACTDNVCMKSADVCLQEIGLTGRAGGAALFGSLSPGTLGAMDVYEVAGGYATSNNNGLALGLLGGFRGAGAPRDRCGPVVAAPPRVTIPQSAFFQGNTRPDTGEPFGLGIGLHQSQLDELAWSLYDGGMLCLTITTRTVGLLTTDIFTLVAPSISNIALKSGAVAVGLRPQAPPTMALGLNTFTVVDGETVVDEPLLDIQFRALELDFYAAIEDQYVRLFTVVTDLRLPLGMQVGDMGDLVPVFGDLAGAFTNVSVKNSEALTEDPAELAERFPSLLELALPGLAGGLGGFALPSIGGLELDVTAITAVDNRQFLAIYADLAVAMARPRVETHAEVLDVVLPPEQAFADPDRWAVDAPPRIELALGGDDTDLEWSWRTDRGLWSAWSPMPTATIAPRTLWVPGVHRIEVRARKAGDAMTTDLTPIVLEVPLGMQTLARQKAGFHGAPGEGGCNCATSGTRTTDALPLAIAFGLLALRRRRRARATAGRGRRALTVLAVLLVGALLPACDCGGTPPCGDKDCLPGEVPLGVIGRYNGAATDGTRTVVTTYDTYQGDVVLVDVAGDLTRTYAVVDGIPDEVPTYHPSGYRNGIATPGPNVGLHTTVALRDGLAQIAYQDVDNLALKFAREEKAGEFAVHTVQDEEGVAVGAFASLALDGQGLPAIAYLVEHVAAAGGGRETQLRLARATDATPGPGEWTFATLASAPASCAGVCASGQACLVPETAGAPEVCAATTTDCTATCGDDQACVGGTCRDAVVAPTAIDLPTGTGLFANLLALPDGRLAVVHYDRARTALVLLVESGAGTSTFTETVLDDTGDRGSWASAIVGPDGAVHVAYQDARADTVHYLAWTGTVGPSELVDDGTRAGDRTHPVGGGATIYLGGGGPEIAYQDGATADLVIARRSGGTWAATALAPGPKLDGFHVAAAGSLLAWDTLDPAVIPATSLSIQRAP